MSLRATATPDAAAGSASRPPVLRRGRRALPALGLVVALAAAGCGVGQKAQTYQERTAEDSTNGAVGEIAVRNLSVQAPTDGLVLPQGSDAPLTVTFINQGGQDDTLLSASTPAATSVEITGPSSTLTVPRLSAASSAYDLVLRGLTRDLDAGSYISLTLSFARNGTQQLLVPVRVPSEGAPRPTSTYEPGDTDSAGKPLRAVQPALTGSSTGTRSA